GPLALDDELAALVELVGDQRVERPALARAVTVHDDDLGRAARERAPDGRVYLLRVQPPALLVERLAPGDLLPVGDAGNALHVADDGDAHRRDATGRATRARPRRGLTPRRRTAPSRTAESRLSRREPRRQSPPPPWASGPNDEGRSRSTSRRQCHRRSRLRMRSPERRRPEPTPHPGNRHRGRRRASSPTAASPPPTSLKLTTHTCYIA